MKISGARMICYGLLLLASVLIVSSCTKKIEIVHRKGSEYHIILPTKAKRSELKAASLLQTYFLLSTGVKLPILRDREPNTNYEICLGNTNRKDFSVHDSAQKLDPDGYRILSSEGKVFIYGGTDHGTLNGVSCFLEDYLGVRVYSSTAKLVPEYRTFSIPSPIDRMYNPPIKFRSTHYRDTWNPAFTNWHKLHHKRDGSHPDWGFWCHSFNKLVPPEEYLREHPEYFALVNGNRIPTQLCLSNKNVLQITIANLRKAMEKNPDLTYWSVSQNDNVSYCRCEECRMVDEKEESPMGSLLNFVNQVADEFPDKVISTLAYQYSRKAPKNIVPASNVNIMLCTIELNRSIPIDRDSSSYSFRNDLEDWAQITDDILLWDYVIQFENLISPFPNLRVLQPNLQYFVENHADKHFQQANREVGGEFSALRGYMISKLLWDPYLDLDSVMNDFLNGYYGRAGKYIRQYIDNIHDELALSGQSLNIFGHPSDAQNTWLRPEKMQEYERIFDKAQKVVRKDSQLLERVRVARMPLEYARIEIALRSGTSPGGMYEKDESGRWIVRDDIQVLARNLVQRAIMHGVTRFKEWHTTPAEYLSSLERSWELNMQDHLALEKKIILKTPASDKYSGGNANLLTDGLRGPQLTFTYNWLGFEGDECEAIIDLSAIMQVNYVSSSWLQLENSWIFLPEMLSYYGSVDKKNWTLLAKIPKGNKLANQEIGVQDFSTTLDAENQIRYIKLRTNSYLKCPDWHPGNGNPAWIFTDEIIVK